MSMQVSQAFIKNFQADVHLSYQQRGSKLKDAVRHQGNIVGSTAVFQKVGKA